VKYLEDFAVGDVLNYEAGPVSSEEIMTFAREWDPQRLHIDPEYASALHGSLIASGFQTLVHVFRPITHDLMPQLANLGGLGVDELRWLQPWRPDEPLKVKLEITSITPSRSKPDRGVLVYRVEARNPRDEVIMTLETGVMLKRKGTAAA
jgi:acyl dehydratase